MIEYSIEQKKTNKNIFILNRLNEYLLMDPIIDIEWRDSSQTCDYDQI